MHQKASSLLSKNQTVIFMGSPLFAIPSLELMHQEFGRKLIVITQPDRPKGRKQHVQATPVKKACENLGIDVFTPKNKLELLQLLETVNPVLIQVVAYGMILPDDVIKRWLCLNVHPSLLPKYRGASPIQSAILSGENKTGCSIIKLVFIKIWAHF